MVTVESLKRVEILIGLTDEQLARVLQICQTRVYRNQDIIVREREPSDEIYVINRGSAEVILSGGRVTAEALAAPGPDAIISLGQGQIFGEMALIDMGPRSATVRCTSDESELYVIRREDFIQLCEQDSDIGYKVMRNLAAELSFKLRHRNLSWRSD
jgi:CRP/FNR family transcriptional regulator, cyclic AMP receptor protein